MARAQGAQAHAAGEAFSLDRKNSWNRPLGAFDSPKNGKLTPDIGIANGFKDRSGRLAVYHRQFRGAWWGHPDYEALYDAKWPINGYDTGSWHTYTDTFDGNEFWLQYRQKVSASRLVPNMPRGKLNYIQNCSTTTAQQLYSQSSRTSVGKLYMQHDGQGAYGNVNVGFPIPAWRLQLVSSNLTRGKHTCSTYDQGIAS